MKAFLGEILGVFPFISRFLSSDGALPFRAKSWCHGHGDDDDDDDDDNDNDGGGLYDVISCCAQTFFGERGPSSRNFLGGEFRLRD